jgi:transposase
MELSEEIKEKRVQFKTFYDQGMNDIQIAEATGVKRKTVCDWRKQNKLPAHALARRRIWEMHEEILLELYEKGMADDQIAEVCGVNPWNVRDWRKKRRLAANLIPGRRGGRKPQKDREYEDSLFRPLYDRGMTDPQIEKETGINRRAVCEWRHRFNLPVNGRKGK